MEAGRADQVGADVRLVEGADVPARGDVPPHFWFGAVREVFEETGVLLARTEQGEWAQDTVSSKHMENWRQRLMNNEARLIDMIAAERMRMVLDDVVYFAHWITPKAEPRRYDTRFFAAALPPGRVIRADKREMIDAIWITPGHALERFAEGKLPMVFPTVRTLQDLHEFVSVDVALSQLQQRNVHAILPRLVRTPTGVGIVID